MNKGPENLLSPQVAVVSGGVESILTSPSPPVPHRRRKKSLQPVAPPSSNRTSVVLPLLSNAHIFSQKRTDDNIGKLYKCHKWEIYFVVNRLWSFTRRQSS